MSGPPGGPGSYSVEPEPARRIIDVALDETAALDRVTADLGLPLDDAATAAGPGSPVAAALARFRGVTEQLARDNRSQVERAAAGARAGIDAYLASQAEMAAWFQRLLEDPSLWAPPPSPLDPLSDPRPPR